MAGGPVPKDPSRKQRRNADGAFTDIVRGERPKNPPKLPKVRSDGTKWRPLTAEWFETWRSAEQATLFLPTDWNRLTMLAEIVDNYFIFPTKDLLGEIRLNEEKLGATVVDRLRARIRVVDDADAAPAAARRRSRPDPRLGVIQGGKT